MSQPDGDDAPVVYPKLNLLSIQVARLWKCPQNLAEPRLLIL